MRKKIWIGTILISLGIWFTLSLFHSLQSKQFSPSRIAFDCEGEKNDFEIAELLAAIGQPFAYLGHGTQSIAFTSQDQKYVLKFFLKKGIGGKKRFKLLSPLLLIPSYRQVKEERRERSLKNALRSYTLAFRDLRDETGLIAIHLSPTQNLFLPLTIHDECGKEWLIDLDRASFVLQKRVTPMVEFFSHLKTKEEREKTVEAVMELLYARAEKGFYDLYGGFNLNNYGFLGDKAILLDPGNLRQSEEIRLTSQDEIQKMRIRFMNKIGDQF